MRTIPLRYLAEINPPAPEFDALPADAEVQFLPLEAVWADSRADQHRTIFKSSAGGYTRFNAGDIVSPKVTPTFQAARSMQVERAGVGTTELHVLRAREGVDPRWVCYALRSDQFLQEGVTAFQGVAGLQRVPADFVASFRVADVGTQEQRRIADFLDDRVARIDQIIAAREGELRLATSAFHSAMGEYFEGASRRPLKTLLRSVTSGPRGWGDLIADSGTPFVRITNLSPLGVELSTTDWALVEMPTDAEARRASLKPGDVMLSITAVFGEVGVWREGQGTFSQHVARLRPIDPEDSDWIAWFLQSPLGHDQYRQLAYGGTKVSMSLEQVRNLVVPDVSSSQRARVGRALAVLWSSHRGGLTAVERQITLLREYKQSLITAAVTGEFDVTTAAPIPE